MLSKEEYIKKIKSVNKLSDNKKQYYIEMAERISSKGMPIILNSFHLSNLAGLKWNVIRVLIDDNVKSYHKFYISKKNKKDKDNKKDNNDNTYTLEVDGTEFNISFDNECEVEEEYGVYLLG